MKAFVTGATGFIGGHVVRKLRARGDEVTVLARSAPKASALAELGCEVIEGDLANPAAIARGAEGCDAVFHVAAIYRVGVPASERATMHDANVRGTERVLDAAAHAGVARVVYVSTANVYGNTKGDVVDETYVRPQPPEFLSQYDRTKYEAHQVALARIAQGAPIVIVMPGGVYGPDDPSELGNMIDQARTGKLKLRLFPATGFNYIHVEDVAEGIILAHDKGRAGQAYNVAGQRSTIGELVDKVCSLSGRKPPRLTMPPALMKAAVPIGPLVGKLLGFPPNLAELIRTSDGVTFWISDEKARGELGLRTRDLDTGLAQTLSANGAPTQAQPQLAPAERNTG